MNRWALLLQLALILLLAGCRQRETENQTSHAPVKVEAKGLHNVYRINDKLISGSTPEGEEGFNSLKELGVKTVISVDGARPELDLAGKYGLRYVHLPVGYDGISRPRILRLARAVRDLPGPVYIHCHHGKHRGPTAAATIRLCLDDKCSVADAVAQMKLAGTDPHYTGLYQAPKALVRPSNRELDQIAADFPEVAAVSALAQVMVQIDGRWENLKLVRAAGWIVPLDHPDLDPPHEALQLSEHYREAGRLEKVAHSADEFRRWLADAEEGAKELERALRKGKDKSVDRPALDEAFRKASGSCVQCHAKYRDEPPKN